MCVGIIENMAEFRPEMCAVNATLMPFWLLTYKMYVKTFINNIILSSICDGMCVGIIENMAEFRPEMCSDAARQGLMQWLLKKLKPKVTFDANKLYSSEILAILLQDTQGRFSLL